MQNNHTLRNEWQRCLKLAFVIGLPVSVVLLLTASAWVNSSSGIAILIFCPALLIITYGFVSGGTGVALYLVAQLLWWGFLVAVARWLWRLTKRLAK